MKIKDLALGIFFIPFLLPIMMISSYQDKKAVSKKLNKSSLRSKKLLTSSDKIDIKAKN